MAHSITPPRSDLIFAVVDMDGRALSWYRTHAAAQKAIDTEWRRFRRRYPADGSRGNATAYLPRTIVRCGDGDQYIERASRYSTAWAMVPGEGEIR